MKTKTNRFLSIFMILTILASLLTSLTMTVSAENYPGGTLLYESFTGISKTGSSIASPTPQPKDTDATINRIGAGEDSGVGLDTYAKTGYYSSSNVLATLPTSYLGSHSNTTLVEAQGPNAKLALEFDFKFEDEYPTEQKTLTAILLGNSSLENNGSTGRANSAVAIFLQSTKVVRVYYMSGTSIKNKDYYLPDGISYDQWHRYKLEVNLTDADSKGASTYTFTVDGKNVVDENGDVKTSFSTLSATEITKLRIDTTASYTTGVDNVSVYKTTETYDSLSTAELMTKLHEVNVKMEGYRAEAEGTEALDNLESAVAAAGTMVTTAFGTYNENGAVVNAAKTQTEVDTALTNLTEAETALKDWIENRTYPGGVLVYESFEGIEPTGDSTTNTTTSQPVGTTATIYKKRKGTDSGAGLGDYARQSGYSNSSFIANFEDPSYFGAYVDDTTTIDEVAAQGSNAKLTLEFDHRMESLATDDQAADLRIMIGTEEMSGTMNSSGRAKSAASVFLKYPNEVSVYYSGGSANTYYLPDDMTIEQWHRYQLTLNLTDGDSKGLRTFTFTVDGKNLVDANGISQTSYNTILSNGAIAKAQLISYYGDVNGVDNVSIYKTTDTYKALSTGALMTKLHEVNAKMEAYQAAEGTEEWDAFDKAVDDAGEMVTTAFGTYDENGTAVNPVKSQEDVDAVLLELENAETALKNVLSPYYVSGLITNEENENSLTGVTVQEIKEAADVNAKMIVATYDENGMVAAQIQAVTAGENTLTSSMDITGKTVKVFIWDMSESALLDYLADVYTFENVVTE